MFNKILVAVDLQIEPAQVLLKRCAALDPGEIWVLHAVEPQYIQYSIDPTFTGSLTQAMEEDAIQAASAQVAEICRPFDIPENHQLIKVGRAADTIHQLATEKDVDTILIGSHAGLGLRRLLGSTANAVVHGAAVNVMTIRMEDT